MMFRSLFAAAFLFFLCAAAYSGVNKYAKDKKKVSAMKEKNARLQDDLVNVELEDLKGAWNKQNNIPGYTGDGVRTSNANPKVSSDVLRGVLSIPSDGTYYVWARGYVGPPYRRGWRLEINGQELDVSHNEKSGSGYKWVNVGKVHLKKGESPIVVKDAASGFETADAVKLARSRGYDPNKEENKLQVIPSSQKNSTAVYDFLIKKYKSFLDQRIKDHPPENFDETRKDFVKRHVASSLGLEKGDRFIPADIKIHKEKIFEDYKIKYLSFQSLPGFYVTCNLYEPLKPSPEGLYPAVVMLCGHSMEKSKAYDCYQKACLGLVKLGFVVLIFDPMGQGERNYPGNEHSENIRGSLIGLSAYGMMVRDAMCAINYLKTCKNVDKSRIGLTGTSGGGGNTFYSALLSQDIAAAFISSYVCGYYDFVATGWGHCNCSYIPGVGACFDQWEILAASCPRPLMVHAGPEDYAFPFKGTKKQVELASAHYKEKGFSGKMRFYLATEYDLEKKRHDKSWLGHGFVLPAREAMYGWFCKCLKGDGDGSPIPEPPMKGKTKEELDVYPKGLPRDKVSFRNIIAKRSDGLARKHLTLTNVKKWKKEASDLRREIKKLLSVDINDPRKGTIKEVVPFGNNIIGEKILFASESSVPCSGIMYKNKKNKNKKSPVVFVLAPIKSLPFPNNFIESLLEKNIAVFVFEPRGFGETCLNHLAMKWLPPGHKKKIGAGLVENVALLLGKPILPQRVGDLLMALKYLEGRKDIDLSRISMSCDGPESSLIASFAIPYCKNDILLLFSEPILSYRKYLHARQGFFCASNILPGIYNIADLANVIALHAPNPLCIIRSGKGSKEEITYIRNVYSMLSASENFISLSQKKDRCKIILQYFNRNR